MATLIAKPQRRLWFGLGPAEAVDELIITWPGGAVQRFKGLRTDQEILVIEDRAQPVTLRTWRPRQTKVSAVVAR